MNKSIFKELKGTSTDSEQHAEAPC